MGRLSRDAHDRVRVRPLSTDRMVAHSAYEESNVTSTPLIEIDNVLKRFPDDDEPVLDHVSIDVADGELVALIGPRDAENRRC